jgi:hypothetical protein
LRDGYSALGTALVWTRSRKSLRSVMRRPSRCRGRRGGWASQQAAQADGHASGAPGRPGQPLGSRGTSYVVIRQPLWQNLPTVLQFTGADGAFSLPFWTSRNRAPHVGHVASIVMIRCRVMESSQSYDNVGAAAPTARSRPAQQRWPRASMANSHDSYVSEPPGLHRPVPVNRPRNPRSPPEEASP